MEGVDAVVVCIVRGRDDVVEGFEDSRGGLGSSTDDGEMSSELVDFNDLVCVETWGGLWKELGVETEDSSN